MEGKRRFSERIATRKAVALTRMSEKSDEIDEFDKPAKKRKTSRKPRRKIGSNDDVTVTGDEIKVQEVEPTIEQRDVTGNDLVVNTVEAKETVKEDPMYVLFVPHIIETIFSYLGAADIYSCGQVCKDWYEESARWLEHHPIDNCALVRKDMTCELDSLRAGKKKKHLKVKDEVLDMLKSERFMIEPEISSEIELPTRTSTPLPKCYWWFSIRGDDILPFMEEHWQYTVGHVQNFLRTKKLAPSFSFICVDDRFPRFSPAIATKIPSIVLQQPSLRITHHLEGKIYEAISTFVKKPRLFESLVHEKRRERSAFKCFHALNVNRYSPDQKIIVTDWSDPSSVKPNLQCPEYPVKAFIYLIGESSTVNHERGIKKFLKNNTCNISRGEIDYGSRLRHYDPNTRTLTSSEAISIAFVGERIQSAVYDISIRFVFDRSPPLTKIQHEVSEFRDKIAFSIDDKQVLGFLFEYSRRYSDRMDAVAERICDLFPSIDFIRIKCRQIISNGRSSFRIHLIRI
ncbi:uncharacterized protein LOC141854387 isoform X2 [Brevipalpus obovatus]|uniref:uncharacterized protein LOC141854387 isoform X2 n=1 Tax=Brevipalpus obovatus TaxID=246614 RepID=UPI003D9E1D72